MEKKNYYNYFISIVIFVFIFFGDLYSQQVPTLTNPMNGGSSYVVNPMFSWYNTSGEILSYNLQISTKSDFSSVLLDLDDIPYTYYISAVLQAGRTYYWHVRSKFGGIYSSFSSTWSFTTPGALSYVITSSAGPNGSISPEGAITILPGGSQEFTITPDADCDIIDVLVDGVSQGALTTYTFNSVSGDHTIEATFKKDNYSITATAGANGTISPSGTVTVAFEGSQTFNFTPASGYEIDDVLVDGESVGNSGSYTFNNVNDDHTINVTFKMVTYTITATAASGGSISPSGDVVVVSGDDQTFDISPEDGYKISDVLVDGVSQGAISSYTFTDVVADHTIDAQFVATTRYYVSVSGNDGNTGTETSPFATVAHALIVATAGDEIVLLNGSFNEGIAINKGVTLSGSGSSIVPYVLIASNDVTLKDLTISVNAAYLPPVISLLYASTFNNINIEEVTIIDNYMISATSGMFLASGCYFEGVSNLNISGMEVSGSCFGLQFHSSNNFTVTDVSLNDNLFTGTMIYNCNDFTLNNVSADGNGDLSVLGPTLPFEITCAGFIFDQVSNGNLNNLSATNNVGDGLLICLSDGLSFTGGDFNNNDYGIHLSPLNNITFLFYALGYSFPMVSTYQNITNLSFTGNVDIIENTYCGILLESAMAMDFLSLSPFFPKIISPVFNGNFTLKDNGLVSSPTFSPTHLMIAGAIENPEFNGLHFKSTNLFNYGYILINGIDMSTVGMGFSNLQPNGVKINKSSFSNGLLAIGLFQSPAYTYSIMNGSFTAPGIGATEDVDAQNNDFMNATSFVNISSFIWDQVDDPLLGLVNYSGSSFGMTKTITLESKPNAYIGASYYLNVSIDCKETPYYYLKGTFTYDPAKLEYIGYISNSLMNDAGWFLDVNNDATLGEITFSGYGLTPIYSDGTLIKLGFKVIDAADSYTIISGIDAEFMGNSTLGEFDVIDGTIVYTTAPGPIQDKGDVTLDAVVTMDDFFALLFHLADVTLLTDPQALINADFNEDGNVDMDDLNELYAFINGTTTSSPVAGNGIVNITDTQYDGTASIELPIQIENAFAVKNVEVTFYFNKDLIDYKSFSLGNQVNNFVYAFESKPGQVKFIYNSNSYENGNLNPGSVALKFVNGVIPVGATITTSYRINNNNDVAGPSISFGEDGTTSVEQQKGTSIPKEFELSQNYPNPFNPSTTISFGLPVNSHTTLKVYDLLGREVVTLFEGELNEGHHSIIWNGENNYGMQVGSGTYIYRIVAGEKIFTRKMMLLK